MRSRIPDNICNHELFMYTSIDNRLGSHGGGKRFAEEASKYMKQLSAPPAKRFGSSFAVNSSSFSSLIENTTEIAIHVGV